MSNIKGIEVNGQVYGLEAQNDIIVSTTEPTGDNRKLIWIQTPGMYNIGTNLPYAHTADYVPDYMMSNRGNITLDENGQEVVTTDTSSSATNHRASVLFGLFKNKQYKICANYANTISSSQSYTYTYYVYFYDSNKQFLNRISFDIEPNHAYGPSINELEFTLPENARYIRYMVPYSQPTDFYIAEEDSDVSQTRMYGGRNWYEDVMYELDNDHYVEI